jgi:hypothetical protein
MIEWSHVRVSGWHIAIYLANFSNVFNRMHENKLVFISKVASEQVRTLDDAQNEKQFRFRDLVDDKGLIFQLEHETRSIYHKAYMRPLVNRMGGNGIKLEWINK